MCTSKDAIRMAIYEKIDKGILSIDNIESHVNLDMQDEIYYSLGRRNILNFILDRVEHDLVSIDDSTGEFSLKSRGTVSYKKFKKIVEKSSRYQTFWKDRVQQYLVRPE